MHLSSTQHFVSCVAIFCAAAGYVAKPSVACGGATGAVQAIQSPASKDDPLQTSIERRDVTAVRAALADGSAIRSPQRAARALMVATVAGSAEIVRILLDQGVDVNQAADATPGHMTALHVAASRGSTALVELLLDRGARVDAQMDNGLTPLDMAAFAGQTEVISLLAKRGAVLDGRDNDGRTALHYAASSGQAAAVRLLLELGADRTAKDVAGSTALDRAQNAKDISDAARAATLATLESSDRKVAQLTGVGSDVTVTPDQVGYSTLRTIQCANTVQGVTTEGTNELGRGTLYLDLADYPNDPAKIWFRLHVVGFPSVTNQIPQCQTGCNGAVANNIITLVTYDGKSRDGNNHHLSISIDRSTGNYAATNSTADRHGQVIFVAQESGDCAAVVLKAKF